MSPTKNIVVLQSNYIPWKGYFDFIAAAEEFLIFDEVQYTRRDWRNRNKVIVAGRPHWISIPVKSKGHYDAPIDQMEVSDTSWADKHWATIALNYRKAAYFSETAQVIEPLYRAAATLNLLTDINELFLRAMTKSLNLRTQFLRTSSIPRTTEDPTGRLIELCQARSATTYISGPAAKVYLDKSKFEQAGIKLKFADYSGYPVYDQGTAVFEHGVSMIDTLMRCGPSARTHLKSQNELAAFLVDP